MQFRKEATRDEPFYLERRGAVPVPLMRQRTVVPYLREAGYQALELAYRGGDLSMVVLLPDDRGGLGDLERGLSVQRLHDTLARMDLDEVEIFLPRFKITWGTNIRRELGDLGMAIAFGPGADFSGINGYAPPHREALFIAGVFHKAFVDVNEEGTEAAATTGVFMTRGLPTEVPIFRADHPFLFAIRDRRSGAILFLGRVADPSGAA